MDPAVSVQHLFGNFLRVDTHDGGANVLAGGDDEGEGEEDHHGEPVVEPEHAPVRVEAAHLHQALQAQEEV